MNTAPFTMTELREKMQATKWANPDKTLRSQIKALPYVASYFILQAQFESGVSKEQPSKEAALAALAMARKAHTSTAKQGQQQ